MKDDGKLVKTNAISGSNSGMGLTNPAHTVTDFDNKGGSGGGEGEGGVELTQITRRHSYSRRQSQDHHDSPLTTEQQPEKTTHPNDGGSKQSTSSPIPPPPYKDPTRSDVFGLCCSGSGHVPHVPATTPGAGGGASEENGDVIVYDVHAGDGDDDEEGNKKGHTALERQLGIEYAVTDVPPIHMCFLFGLQQVLLSISSTISIPLIVSAKICAGDLTLVQSEIMSTFLFMCGVCTLLQVLVGVRLPIIQGGCHKFIPAITALIALDIWKCPTNLDSMVAQYNNGSTEALTEVWQSRMREIQGGIMLASLAQILIGCTGFLGILLQYLGPITIVPTISLIGLSLVDVALMFCEKHWGITALTVGLVFLFSLYLRNIRIPFPTCTRKNGCSTVRYPIFKLLPVIFAVILAWGFSAVLTATDTLKGKGVRTDSKTHVLDLAGWFFFPYPGQWGMPTISVASFMAMLAATITSIIESVGDYYSCARISGVPPPPAHAVNRGIAIEGLGSLISGAVGSGGATTSYSQNVGSIGFTKVASRWAFFTAGLIFLASGLCGKFGAMLTMMPDPVLGGIVLVSFGMVTAVGLSTLSFLDLSSGRNLTIIGSSLIIGLMVPEFMEGHPDAIDTGNKEADNVISVLLGTAMFVGGVLAFFLDNTVPGTPEERGIIKWRQHTEQPSTNDNSKGADGKGDNSEAAAAEYLDVIYGFPCMSKCLQRVKCCKYVPFMPSFSFKPGNPFKWLLRKFKKDN